MSLYTTQYIHKDDSKIDGYSKNDIINLIETGVLSDTSVGFTTGGAETHICSICGNSIYDWKKCEHIPGRKYIVDEETNKIETCIEELHKPKELSEEGNNLLMENSLVFDGAYPNAVIQSKLSKDSKDETFKVLEGKPEMSEKDTIVGYTSKEGVNLLYTHLLEKGGEELKTKKLANEENDELEEVTETEETVENEEEIVEEEVVEETVEEEEEKEEGESTEEKEEENVEEDPEEQKEQEEKEEQEEENPNEDTESNLYTEADIISKFGNIADSFEGLIQLAKEGLEYKNETIKQALDSGVHSMGNAFNKEVFAKTFSSMSTKDIKEMAEVWESQAKAQFSDKKVSKQSNAKDTKNDDEIIVTDYSKYKTGNY